VLKICTLTPYLDLEDLHMKRIIVTALILFSAVGLFADEWEVGMSFFAPPPIPDNFPIDPIPDEDNPALMPSFHFGYSWWGIFYASWDATVLPPYTVFKMTETVDWSTGNVADGFYRPGFLNFYDVGARLKLGPFVGFGTVGINTLYVYGQSYPELAISSEERRSARVGANIRLGAGLVFDDWWGMSLVGTSMTNSISDSFAVLGGLISRDAEIHAAATDYLRKNTHISLMFTLYL
jgi:hypothetical protein